MASQAKNRLRAHKIRILFLCPHFAEYSLRLAVGFLGGAPEIKVKFGLDSVNFKNEIDPEFRQQYAGLDKFFFRTDRRPYRYLGYIKIIIICLIFRPHIIHIQESGNPLTPDLMPILSKLAKVALTIHDPVPHLGTDTPKATWRRRLRTRQSASLVFAHDTFCAEVLASPDAGALSPIAQTRHGVLLVPRPEDIVQPDMNRILFFGRMEAYKGLEILLDAVEILVSRGCRFVVVVAGKGPELDRLRARIDGMPCVVVLDKWLSAAEVIREFQKASFVVLPYLDATQSGVVAAAFGNGRAVAASRVGGLAAIVDEGRNGVLFPPADPAALADALQALLENPSHLEHLMAGAARTGQMDLNWDGVARGLIQSYHEHGLL